MAIDAFSGFTTIETSAAGVTVSVTGALVTAPDVAVITVVPAARLVARPILPAVLLIVAVAAVAELQVAVWVRSCVELSVNVPIAVNCCVVPSAIEGAAGVTAIDTNAAGATVSEAVPLTAPDVAIIVTVPCATVLASPFVGTESPIVATLPVPALQCTVAVRSGVVPSVNVPVAVNCCMVPSGIVVVSGFTAIDTTAAGVTVIAALPTTALTVAVMCAAPAATAFASP